MALLQTSRQPSLALVKDGNVGSGTFQPVNKSTRLLHLLIDVLFVSYVAYTFLGTIAKMIIIDGYQTVLLIINLMVLFLGIYYLLMELFFKVTFAKIITNTIVINRRGQKAGIFQIIGRSFCRFIPFEGVSFLFNDRGWHDRLSGTYVVKDQYSWETKEDTFDTYFTGEPESEPTTTLIP
ncbi:RDD family protein [Parasegetibacter sp. MAH-26]|uniref:RDD family protein n=2 Tax=Pinibacter aurantiacus TaxID=2851599 RepID=A0A9E2W752_9BACT|nr:RDD family protein [Pinibacter aurantiacus]